MKIAYFISPHGFGHAARSAAVMQAIEQKTAAEFYLYTTVPDWFFRDTVKNFIYRSVETDLGLVQTGPMKEDLEATCQRLKHLFPYPEAVIDRLADEIRGVDYVVCDIAPLGIDVAKRAGVPSVLVENFTWDWIYEAYLKDFPKLGFYIDYLKKLFNSADIRIQAVPVCNPGLADLIVRPISRTVRTTRKSMRKRMGIPDTQPAVLISMGGVPGNYPFLKKLESIKETLFIIPGGGSKPVINKNLRILKQNSGFYHPDLIGACDALICKAGYSTLAECYHAGMPTGYLLREQFPEMPALENFLTGTLNCCHITNEEWNTGQWVRKVPDILKFKKIRRNDINGADQIADFLLKR